MDPAPSDLADLIDAVLDAAFFTQAQIGTLAREREYADLLSRELLERRVPHRRDGAFPVEYEGLRLERAFVVDFVVDARLILLARRGGRTLNHHAAHLETYVRPSRLDRGLVVDFGCDPIERGIRAVWRVDGSDARAAAGVSR